MHGANMKNVSVRSFVCLLVYIYVYYRNVYVKTLCVKLARWSIRILNCVFFSLISGRPNETRLPMHAIHGRYFLLLHLKP
jgi:hypothetical protein